MSDLVTISSWAWALGLVGLALAAEADQVSVERDDIVTGIDVRRVVGAVLAHQHGGDLRRQAAHDVASGVNDKPTVGDRLVSSHRRTGGTNRNRGHGAALDEMESDAGARRPEAAGKRTRVRKRPSLTNRAPGINAQTEPRTGPAVERKSGATPGIRNHQPPISVPAPVCCRRCRSMRRGQATGVALRVGYGWCESG